MKTCIFQHFNKTTSTRIDWTDNTAEKGMGGMGCNLTKIKKFTKYWCTGIFEELMPFELWCWRRLESPLDCKEIQPVHPRGDQSWMFIGGTDAEAETPNTLATWFKELTLCDPMNCSTPGLPVYHQLLEFTQTHVHWVGEAIQPSDPLSSPSPPAPNPS